MVAKFFIKLALENAGSKLTARAQDKVFGGY